MYLGFWSDVSMLIPITPINSKGAIPVYWLKCICRCQTRVRVLQWSDGHINDYSAYSTLVNKLI